MELTIDIVYPDGKRGALLRARDDLECGDLISDASGEFVVGFMDRVFSDRTRVAYLDHAVRHNKPERIVWFPVGRDSYPLSLAEAAELRREVRGRADHPRSPATTVAVALDQLIEGQNGQTPRVGFRRSEYGELDIALENWLWMVGDSAIPERIMQIRYAVKTALRSVEANA